MKPTSQAFNNKTLSYFNKIIYKDVLGEEHIMGNEIAVDVEGVRTPGYVLKKGIRQYFLRSEDVCNLPVKVKDTFQVINSSSVYHFISKYNTIKVESKDSLSFRSMVDGFCNLKSLFH